MAAFSEKWEKQYPTAVQELEFDYQSVQDHGQ